MRGLPWVWRRTAVAVVLAAAGAAGGFAVGLLLGRAGPVESTGQPSPDRWSS